MRGLPTSGFYFKIGFPPQYPAAVAHPKLEPIVAKKQTGRLVKGIREPDALPMRCPVYAAEPWKSIGLRTLPVDNFAVLFLTDERTDTVSIVRILYGGRDINTELAKEI